MSHPRRHLKPLSLLLALSAVLLGHPFPVWSGSESDPGPWPKILSTELVMDRAYQEQTRKDRDFTPVPPFSPFDTFEVVAKAQLLCQWKAHGSGRAGLLWTYGFRATLMTTDTQGHEVAIASARVGWVWESEAEQRDACDTYGTYVAQFAGWPNGLAQGEQLELLIESIAAGRRVWVRMQAGEPDADAPIVQTSTSFAEDKDIPMTNCVRVWGKGPQRIVRLRVPPFDPRRMIQLVESVRTLGFETFSPFMEHRNAFSHLVDLKNYPELDRNRYPSDNVRKDASCGTDVRVWVIYSEAKMDKNGNFQMMGSLPMVHGVGGTGYSWITQESPTDISDVLDPKWAVENEMHELGHAFCGANDEYVTGGFGWGHPTTCASNPNVDYCYDGNLYGETRFKGCTRPEYFRPSANSLMKSVWPADYLNVISCGHCLWEIDGGKRGPVSAYWPLCMQMDGVIKPPTPLQSCPAQ